jgi:hypothetical protein
MFESSVKGFDRIYQTSSINTIDNTLAHSELIPRSDGSIHRLKKATTKQLENTAGLFDILKILSTARQQKTRLQ